MKGLWNSLSRQPFQGGGGDDGVVPRVARASQPWEAGTTPLKRGVNESDDGSAHAPPFSRRLPRGKVGRSDGFTMIEIAISLAIIAFAMVAIIGILPQGMEVQRQNREDTTINQEATVLLNAIRNGDQGLNDLTNYVTSVTISRTLYSSPSGSASAPTVFNFTRTSPGLALTNGFVVVGLLTTPKYVPQFGPAPVGGGQAPYLGFYSNHVVATVRAMSGSASDMVPQSNPSVQEMAFTYRVICELTYYGVGNPVSQNARVPVNNGWPAEAVDFANYPAFSADWLARSNNFRYFANLQGDLWDVRLVFRWPVLPSGSLGNSGRQVFRSVTAGPVQAFLNPLIPAANQSPVLFFVQPKAFVSAQ